MSVRTSINATDPRTGVNAPLPGFDLTPLTLAGRAAPPPYPVEALGAILAPAAKALAHYVQVPLGMSAQSVLAAASLAVQGHIDIKKGNIGHTIAVLFCITEALSGERKSSLDNQVIKPIYEFQAERRAEYKSLLADYTAECEAHEIRHQSIIRSYRGAGKKPKPLSHDEQKELSEELAELEKNKPKAPDRPHILMEEPTAEGIYKHFVDALPIAGLFSDEGGAFFAGHGMAEESKGRTITMLSQLWDGKPITRTRAGAGESGVLAGRRLSAHLMVQPVIADKVLSDPLMMGQGFLARFLVCSDTSIVGTRFLADRDPNESPTNDPAVTRFWDLISELIRKPLPVDEAGELQPEIMEISGDAYAAWVDLHDAIEEQLSPQGEFSVVREFAAKAADNAARIAGILAYIETRSAPTTEHIERAGQIMNYYLKSMILRTQDAAQSSAEHEAHELFNWIQDRGGELDADDFKKLPAVFRSAKKARPLLGLLVSYGHAVVTVTGPNGKPRAWKTAGGISNV